MLLFLFLPKEDFQHLTVPVFFFSLLPSLSVWYSWLYLCCWIGRLAKEKGGCRASVSIDPLSKLQRERKRLRRKHNPQSFSSSATPLHLTENLCSLVNPLTTDCVPFLYETTAAAGGHKHKEVKTDGRNETEAVEMEEWWLEQKK